MCILKPTMKLAFLQVSRAVRSASVTGTIDAGLSWPSQILSALQQRGYIASAGASDRPPAFAFDIDGVLIRGSRVLEPAKKALARLYRDGGMGSLLSCGKALQQTLQQSCHSISYGPHTMIIVCKSQGLIKKDVHAGRTPRYPICFLTNGGGVSEQQKADELSSWLGVQVKENQARTHGPRCKFKLLIENTLGTQTSAAS